MAFPTVASTTPTVIGTASTSHPVAMPATVDAGDLLLVAGSVVTGATTAPAGGGWTLLHQTTVGAIIHGNWYKIADGTEGGTSPVWTTALNRKTEWHVRRVTGWHGTTPPEIGTAAAGSSTGPDPPNLTPSWGSADTLWIVTGGFNGATTVTTYPANYATNGIDDNTTAAGANAVGSSWRTNAAASEDPDAFLISGSVTWVAQTLAVRPAAAGGVTGTLTATQDSQTGAFTGQTILGGNLAAIQADQTAAFTGSVLNPITGTLSSTQADQTAALTGSVGLTGALSASQADNTAGFTGSVGDTGTIAATQADQTATFVGMVANPITGVLAAVQADQTATFTGQSVLGGNLAGLNEDQTANFTGTVLNPITGTLNGIQDDQTGTFTGATLMGIVGTVAATQADQVGGFTGNIVNPTAGNVVKATSTVRQAGATSTVEEGASSTVGGLLVSSTVT